jgi:hypothetical protein
MGTAKDLVGKPGDEIPPPKHAKPPTKPTLDDVRTGKAAKEPTSVITDLSLTIDKLDRALQVKQQDIHTEGRAMVAENHYKLGILQGALSLLRRARAMLQDYGTDLELTIHPDADEDAVDGERLEEESDNQLFAGKKDPTGKC